MQKRKMKTMSVVVDEETFNKLKKDADEKMCSISLIVRDALHQYYKNKSKGDQND